jgi:REP element-mobilizing transposase RayT
MRLPNRRSTRWQGFDYTSGAAYFLTMCVAGRETLFGDVIDGEVRLSEIGMLVDQTLHESLAMRPEIELVTHVVMPNHLHLLIIVNPLPDVGAHGRAPVPPQDPATPPTSRLRRPPRSVGSLVAAFKAASARAVNDLHGTPGLSFWQRGYHDRIVRNDRELAATMVYIENNPLRWREDAENPLRSL